MEKIESSETKIENKPTEKVVESDFQKKIDDKINGYIKMSESQIRNADKDELKAYRNYLNDYKNAADSSDGDQKVLKKTYSVINDEEKSKTR